METNFFVGYWRWFFRGSGGKPGYRRIINWWLLIHIGIGIILALLVEINLHTAAEVVLLPLVGILIGLSFAWAGNAQALMQSKEIQDLSDYHEGGFVEYIYTYQTAILVILITLILWALAGLQVFDTRWPTIECDKAYTAVETILFTFSSLTLRECWHVVLGSTWMLSVQIKIRKKMGERRDKDKHDTN